MTLYYEDYRLDGTPDEIYDFLRLIENGDIIIKPIPPTQEQINMYKKLLKE